MTLNTQQSGRPDRAVPAPRISARAFTLFEVLIATLIFATVLAALNAVLFAGLQLRSKTSNLLDEAAPLNRAAALIRRDLQGLTPPGEILAGPLISGTQPTGTEEFGGLEFFTSTGITTDLQIPRTDVQKVGYYLRVPTNVLESVGKDLVRLVTRNLLATVEEWPVEQRLLGGVERLQFYFLNESEPSWRDYWDSTTEAAVLPKAIKMRLEFAADPRDGRTKLPFELVVPVLTQKRTNSTETAEGETTETPGGGGNNPPPSRGSNNSGGPGGGAPGGGGQRGGPR